MSLSLPLASLLMLPFCYHEKVSAYSAASDPRMGVWNTAWETYGKLVEFPWNSWKTERAPRPLWHRSFRALMSLASKETMPTNNAVWGEPISLARELNK